MDLTAAIRTIPDYPIPGIMFRDITTLLADARGFRRAVDELVQPFAGMKIDKVAGIEARGFILGGAVAHQLSAGFIPLRKKGKLPHKTIAVEYALEYGVDVLEMHQDGCCEGERVLLIDALAEGLGVAQEGGDVTEHDPRDRVVGNRADSGRQVHSGSGVQL